MAYRGGRVSDGEHLNDPSKLARARFGAGLIGLLLRAWTSNQWSFQASLVVLIRSSLGQSKRARVKEQRLSENTMGLVCRLPRAQGLTRLILPFWCAPSASTGDQ